MFRSTAFICCGPFFYAHLLLFIKKGESVLYLFHFFALLSNKPKAHKKQ